MNDEEELAEAVHGILMAALAKPDAVSDSGFNRIAWDALEQAGFTLVGVADDAGGSGGTLRQAAIVLQTAAQHPVCVPLAETSWLAGWLMAQAGAEVPPGPLTAALATSDELLLRRVADGWLASGRLARVPYAASADLIVCLVGPPNQHSALLLEPQQCTFEAGANLAGEPRETVVVDALLAPASVLPLPSSVDACTFLQRAAVARAIAMAGAARRVVRLSITQSRDRVQFGRPIGRFQAVQQHLAVMASEAVAIAVAAQAAVSALESGSNDAAFAVHAAKATASESTRVVVELGHQILGALGFTLEHPLHYSTTRLLSWREEYGNESVHSRLLATRVLDVQEPDLWQSITGMS
jgi:acyl-CoA dehydrogenase